MKNENLSDLKKLSANWSPDQWEKYLSSIESRCKEVLINPRHYDILAETKSISLVFKDLPLNDVKFKPNLTIRQAINKLSKNEKKVIIGLYWYDLTQEELAVKFGLSRQTINTNRTRALKKMKNFISLNSHEKLMLACTEEFKIS